MMVSTMPSRFLAATWMSRSASSFGEFLPHAPAHLDEVAEPEDRRQRGAQLVLHRREKVGLHGVELAQPANQLPLQLVEARILHRDRRVVGESGQNTLDLGVDRRSVRHRRHGERSNELAEVGHRQHQQRPAAGKHPSHTSPRDHVGRRLPPVERVRHRTVRIDDPDAEALALAQRDRRRGPLTRDRGRGADDLALELGNPAGGAGQCPGHGAHTIHRALDRDVRVRNALHAPDHTDDPAGGRR